MLVRHLKSLENIVKGFVGDQSASPLLSDYQATTFEQQLTRGLKVQLIRLNANAVGWSYRNSPVFVFGLQPNPTVIHLSAKCSHVQPLQQYPQQWGWAASDVRSIEHDNLELCDECAGHLSLDERLKGEVQSAEHLQSVFLNTVKRASHAYFHPASVLYWQPGHKATALTSLGQAGNVTEAKAETEAKPEKSCHHCTWQTKTFLIDARSIPNSTTENTFCYACFSDHGSDCIAIPEIERWRALEARFHYFNGTCQNWAHLLLHLDKTWHDLVHQLRKQGVALPVPYYVVQSDDTYSAMATLAWPNKKQGIIADDVHKADFPNDWQVMHVSEIMQAG